MTTNLNERLAITAVGTCTCVGQNTQQTSASIRAGLNRFVEHPAYLSVARAGADPEDPVPPAVAMVPTLDPELNSQDRLMQLLITAFRDLVHNRQFNRSMMARAGFFLALPSDDPDMMPFGIGTDFVKDFAEQTAMSPFPVTKVVRSGNTGMAELIREAALYLGDGQLQRCIVAGVDSYFIGNRLEMLDRARRLKSSRNMGGFIPGEGATAIMIEPVKRASAKGSDIRAIVEGIGLQTEPNPLSGEKASTGQGLSAAIRHAVAGRGDQFACHWVIGDLNGEAYRSFEWGTVMVRLRSLFATMQAIWHPVDCVGDIGAATPGLHIAQAVTAMKRGYAPAGEALVWSSSDGGQRAALLVSGEK
jgi:3-oxoacyl-[acyl-carrier-protein] synthase-1